MGVRIVNYNNRMGRRNVEVCRVKRLLSFRVTTVKLSDCFNVLFITY